MEILKKHLKKTLFIFSLSIIGILFINILIFVIISVHPLFKQEPFSPQSILEQIHFNKSKNDVYSLTDESIKLLNKTDTWLMLLDGNNGNMLLSHKLPHSLEKNYTPKEIAFFSRYYLEDYPVFIWNYEDNFMVLGYPKDGYYRIANNYFSSQELDLFKHSAIVFITSNLLFLLLLPIIFYYIIVRKTKPILNAIDNLPKYNHINLPEKGPLQELNQNINKASNLLIKNMTSKKNWINSISHDIRTPLTMITSLTNKIRTNTKNKDTDTLLCGIDKCSLRISKIIKDMNILIKIDYPDDNISQELFYPIRILKESISYIINISSNDKIIWDININPYTLGKKIIGNSNYFRRAMDNLLSNCIIHSNLKYPINITTKLVNNNINIKFSNQCKQTNKVHKKNSFLNHGLGLKFVREIIRWHNGHINISKTEKKFIVYISLPNKI